MNKKHRLLATLLVFAFAFAAIPFAASAYGKTDKRLSITHINTPGSMEGAGIIEAGCKYATLSATGSSFNWWKVVVFDWDESESVFKVSAVLENSNNVGKGNTAIPEKGFAYAVCTGNNYPALYASSGNSDYKDKPNYVNAPTKDSCDFVTSANIKVGDKAYLYNTDLAN
ncbi:MAG: hypothetical protein J6252_02645, partial [Clostridia bacterium]|nr:hypothetical protein [Clostridia bacterium]